MGIVSSLSWPRSHGLETTVISPFYFFHEKKSNQKTLCCLQLADGGHRGEQFAALPSEVIPHVGTPCERRKCLTSSARACVHSMWR